MKLEDQVVSLELAKRLKELGVKQESLFYWRNAGMLGWQVENHFYIRTRIQKRPTYSAFTVAELGEMLKNYGMDLPWPVDGKWWFNTMAEDGMLDTEADARASMLINLLESKTLTQPPLRAKEINQDWQ